MTQKQREHRALIVSAGIYVFIAGAGFWVWQTTGIQALFLDFFFSFIAFVSSVAAAAIARLSHRRTTHYPEGLWFMEPLYAVLKSLVTLALLATSLISTFQSAWAYFTEGVGAAMRAGPVLPYAALMVVLCFGLGLYNQAQNRKINNTSTMLAAEAKTNFVDGIQSMGVGLSIVLLNLIPEDSVLGFLHYTGDFFVTLVLVLVSLKEPVTVLITAFRELTVAVTDQQMILNEVLPEVVRCFGTSPVRVRKVGMLVRVEIEAVTPGCDVFTLLLKREALQKILSHSYENLQIVLCTDMQKEKNNA